MRQTAKKAAPTKKAAAKKAPAKKAARKAPAKVKEQPAPEIVMRWSREVEEHVQPAAGPDFAAHLRALANAGSSLYPIWEHAELLEERGLEMWVGWLGPHERLAFVTAAAAAARHAYPLAMARAGSQAMEFGLAEEAPCGRQASAGTKLRKVEAWLGAPSTETHSDVKEAVDRTRQLEVWDDDLRPPAESSWFWFFGVGQLCAQSVVQDEDGVVRPNVDSDRWPASVCAARCAVAALKSIRAPGGDVGVDVAGIGRAIARAFEIDAFAD